MRSGKTSKKKKRKSSKKKSNNIGITFLCTLLVFIILLLAWQYYQDITSSNTPDSQAIKTTEAISLKPTITKEAKKATSKTLRTHDKKEKKPAPAIIHYEYLELPVSYSDKPQQIIYHTGYTVSYNPSWKIPNWVAYELTRLETRGTEKRDNNFIPDPQVKGRTAIASDYAHSGYDRGHMAPAADMKWSSTVMKESFYLSNICPQHPQLNQRAWQKLEDKVRDWAVRDSAIIIVCGPLVSKRPQTIGKNEVAIPDGFFKVILSPFIASPQAIGFVFKNEKSLEPLRSYTATVDSIETLAGLDFFSPLPDEIEDVIEAFIDTLYWEL